VRRSTDAGLDWLSAGDHAATCDVCGPLLRAHHSAQASLRSLSVPVRSERTSACPDESVWSKLAAHALRGQDTPSLLEHASACGYCGQLLREATEDLKQELSADEKELIGRLSSARPDWQRELSHRMAEMSMTGKSQRELVAQRKTDSFGWPAMRVFSENRIRWGVPVAAVLILAIGIGVLTRRSRSSPRAANQLLASAYGEQRPFVPRLSNAEYGPLRQRRGEGNGARSSDLLDAEAQVARGLTRSPLDPNWLHAKGRAELLEGNYDSALDALQRAAKGRPKDASIKVDLAVACFLQTKYDTALQLLNEVIAANPEDSAALFNRALVYERQQLKAPAASDWRQFLRVSHSGDWSAEARQHLDALGTN
jgi:tetratricopeptide (TPR) repeat protein